METLEAVHEAKDVAGLAQRVWLMASGLADEIDDLRFQPEERVVPAPGLETLRQAADAGAARAHELANRVAILAREAQDDSITRALDELHLAVVDVQTAARRLAQLGMGVSSAPLGGERIERLDRACVAVLRASDVCSTEVRGAELALTARTRAEAAVELGGLFCRLLVDRRPALAATAGAATARIFVDRRDVLYTECRLGDGPATHHEWESSVVVSEPVHVVLEALLNSASVADIILAAAEPGDPGFRGR